MKQNELIKICLLLQKAKETGYNKEVNFITSFLLKNGLYDLYFEPMEINNKNKFDNCNYIDNLSFELTDKFNVGYSCFVVTGLKYDILVDYKYNNKELSVCSLEGIDKLFDLIPVSYFVKNLNHTSSIELLKTATKEILLNKTVNEVNSILVDFVTYNKCSKVSDFVFKRNDSYYLKYDVDSSQYSEVDITEVKQFIFDFVNSLEYIEEFELIYEYIL